MTVGEDLRPRAGAADERIVRRHLAVVTQAQHLAVDRVQLLRLIVEWRAGGHVQHAVRTERDAGAAGAVVPIADHQLFDVGQRLAVELAAHQRDGSLPLVRVLTDGAGLVVGQVDQLVGGELRVERHLVQATGPERRCGRHTGHRVRLQRGRATAGAGRVRDQPQPFAALGHERIPVGQEGEAERMRQAAGHHHHAQAMLFGGVEHVGPGGHGNRGDADHRLILLGPASRHRQGGYGRDDSESYRARLKGHGTASESRPIIAYNAGANPGDRRPGTKGWSS